MHVIQLNTDKLQHPRVYSNARALGRISFHPAVLQEMAHTARTTLHYAGSWTQQKCISGMCPGLSECIACELHIVKYTLL